MNIFYRWLMNSKAYGLYLELENIIKVINEHNLVNGIEVDASHFLSFSNENEYFIYKKDNGEKTSYNIFYDNLHIRLEVSPKEKVYSIHLKKVEDNWCFNITEGKTVCDYSHPTNQTFRIFVSYDIPVLNITRAVGDTYSQGTWDKYVYNKLNEFEEIIDGCTDSIQFNKIYK